jgi:hypothetical protein
MVANEQRLDRSLRLAALVRRTAMSECSRVGKGQRRPLSGSSQDWMRERPTDRCNGSVDFLLCGAHESSINSRPGLYRVDIGIEIDPSQESVDQRAEASPFWPFGISTLRHLHDNIPLEIAPRNFELGVRFFSFGVVIPRVVMRKLKATYPVLTIHAPQKS